VRRPVRRAERIAPTEFDGTVRDIRERCRCNSPSALCNESRSFSSGRPRLSHLEKKRPVARTLFVRFTAPSAFPPPWRGRDREGGTASPRIPSSKEPLCPPPSLSLPLQGGEDAKGRAHPKSNDPPDAIALARRRAPLDPTSHPAHVCAASRPGGRSGGDPGEESPGSTERRCRSTTGEGDLRESATENEPPRCGHRKHPMSGPRGRDLPREAIGVRVKRWGKSPPRTRQRGRHGKPHREQDRIGAARARKSSGLFRTSRPGWLREASGNGRPRRMAATWGKPRHTEPGLQADWHSPPRHTPRRSPRPTAVTARSIRRGVIPKAEGADAPGL